MSRFAAFLYSVSGSTREFKIAPGALADYGAGSVVFVTAFKSDFMKSTNAPQATFSVVFVASSRQALIKIRR